MRIARKMKDEIRPFNGLYADGRRVYDAVWTILDSHDAIVSTRYVISNFSSYEKVNVVKPCWGGV